jgi:hypothetical protein
MAYYSEFTDEIDQRTGYNRAVCEGDVAAPTDLLVNATPSYSRETAGVAFPDAHQKRCVRFFMTSIRCGPPSPYGPLRGARYRTF